MSKKKYIIWVIVLLGCAITARVDAGTIKVSVLGSSTFYDGCYGSDLNGVTNGFVTQLKKTLSDHEFICDNLVQTSAKSSFFLTQFKNFVESNGSNDLILYAGLNGLDTSIAQNQSDIASIISAAKAKGMRIIGVGAQPFKGWSSWTPKFDENIKANNAWFKNNVDVYIDYYSILDGNGDSAIDAGLSKNALHANDAGQKLLYEAIMNYAYSGQGQSTKPAGTPSKPKQDPTDGTTVWKAITGGNKPLTQDEVQQLIQIPRPKIKIPGLNFSNITPDDFKTSIDGSVYLHKPFFAEYIVAIYKYLMVIAGIFCAVQLIVAGMKWSLPDASGESKATAKKIFVSSVSGLVIALTSYVILYTINPNLVSFKTMGIQFIQPQDFAEYIAQIGPDGTLIKDPNFHHDNSGSGAKLSNENIVAVSEKLGLDQCLLWSFVHKESGGNLHAIGDDENYAYNNKPVGSRKAFLLSGKKYSGTAFAPPVTSESEFDYKKHNNTPVLNDDEFDISKPPDYGIDWRFSHGISFLQITIFPTANGPTGKKIDGPNGPEWARRIYGRWYTVTDLLNADTSLEAGIRFITHGETDSNNCSNKALAVEAFKCLSVSDAAMGRALEYYQKCPLQRKMAITNEDLQKYPAKGSH